MNKWISANVGGDKKNCGTLHSWVLADWERVS